MPLTSHVLSGYRQLWLASGLVLAAVLLLAGCDDADTLDRGDAAVEPPSKSNAPAEAKSPSGPAIAAATINDQQPAEPQSGKQLLEQMAAAYRAARSYRDQGVARISYKLAGKEEKHEFPFSLSFAAPNKLKLAAYEGQVVSDGAQVRAVHAAVPGYVRVQPAPERLTAQHVFGDNFLWSQLNERQAGGPVQLELLLSEQFLSALLQGCDGEPQLTEVRQIDDEACRGVRLSFDQGAMTYWIGQRTHLLRRIEFPTDELRKMLEQDGEVSDLQAIAEFTDAQFDAAIDDSQFALDLPAGTKEVKQFVGPAPPAILGRKLDDFAFTSLDGEKIDAASLAGKVVVLDFWATWCQYCLERMPDVAKTHEQFKDNEQVAFLTVSVDQPDVKNDAVREKLSELKISLPAARDTDFEAFTKFSLPGVPAMVILGKDGTLQDIAVGLPPEGVDPVADLAAKIEALLAGKDLYQRVFDEFESAMQEEPPQIGQGPNAPPEVKIAERSEPERLVLTPLWQNRELQQPGNMLVFENDSRPRILVIEGYQAIAELDGKGELIHRHEPELPSQAAIAFLRTALDKDGKRWFAASAVGGQQVFILDEKLTLHASYPAQSAEDDAIGDAQLVDLNGDGQLEVAVAQLGKKGIALLSLDGKPLWSDGDLEDVVSLTVAPAAEQDRGELWCVFPPGKVARFDAAGQRVGEPMQVDAHYLRLLTATGIQAAGSEFAGLAYAAGENGAVTDVLVGVDAAGKSRWTYALPTGQQPWLEQLVLARLTGNDRHWIIAAADGSLHFVACDGRPLDRFNTGAAISGFCVVSIDGQPHLILGGEAGVSAWKAQDK